MFSREECFVLQAVCVRPANGRPVNDFSQRICLHAQHGLRIFARIEEGGCFFESNCTKRGWYCVRVSVPDLFFFCLYALCLSTQTSAVLNTFQREIRASRVRSFLYAELFPPCVCVCLKVFAVAVQNGFLCRSILMREECFVLQAVRVSPANGRPVYDCFFAAQLFPYSVWSPRLCQ